MKDVFICHTPYHVYIACVKRMVAPQGECAAWLADTIPGWQALQERLTQSGIFTQVMGFDRLSVFPRRVARAYVPMWLYARTHPRRMRAFLNAHVGAQDRLIFSNDYTALGAVVQSAGRPYFLLEDSRDTFARVNDAIGKAKPLKRLLYKVVGVPYMIGQSPLCRELEVHNAAIVRTPFACPIREQNRDVLIARLTPEQIGQIQALFQLTLTLTGERKRLLLLTQPLIVMGLASDAADTLRFYERMLLPNRAEYDIYIKPHPRDAADYTRLSPPCAGILDRAVPVEILNFMPGVRFALGLTYDSTSVNGLTVCERVVRARAEAPAQR